MTKSHSSYLSNIKENLNDDTAIILLEDYTENYSSLNQDEIQNVQWNNVQVTLHTVVIYECSNSTLKYVVHAL